MTVTQRETMSVRVRRRIRLAPLAVWSSILGALSGALASVLFVRPGWLLFFWLRPLYQLLLMGMIVLVPALLLAPWLGSRCQRPGHVYLAGQTYCSLYVWALLLVSATLGPGATAGLTLTTLVSVLGAGLIVGVAGGLANLLLLLVNRTFLFLVLEQDGSLCSHCGYQVGAPPATPRCPECGTLSRAQARPAPRWSRALRSNGHWAGLALFCVLATAIMAHRFVVEGAETRAFLRAFGGSNRMFEGVILGEGGRGAWESVGVYQELPARPGQIVMILYDATREPGEPAMQVRLGTLTRTPGGHLFPADASPCVMSSLDEQQAEYATAKGIPPSLIDELIDVAAAAGWPAAGRPAPPVTVDAAPHFPAAVAASAPPDAAPAPPSVLRPGPPGASPGLQWADLRRSLGLGRSGRPGNAALAVLLLLSAAWLVGGLLLLRRVKRALRARASCRACGHHLGEAFDTGPRCPACQAMLADVGVTLPGRVRLVAAGLACVLVPVVTFLALGNADRCVRTIRVIFVRGPSRTWPRSIYGIPRSSRSWSGSAIRSRGGSTFSSAQCPSHRAWGARSSGRELVSIGSCPATNRRS